MSEVELYLPNLRGAAVTVGKRTHVLLQTKRQPNWAGTLQLPSAAPTLGDGLIGLMEYDEQRRAQR